MSFSRQEQDQSRRLRGFFAAGLVMISALVFLMHFGATVWAQDKSDSKKMGEKGTVLNLQGREIGSVDSEGKVYNRNGECIGSVDAQGNVYNIGKAKIGVVDSGGEIRNQLGTLLGFVDVQGIVYNRLRKEVGSVDGIHGLNITGGAARLLFFSGRR